MAEHAKREGDPGTWSHCGERAYHAAHLHSFAMNEGPYTDVPCNGTPWPAEQPEQRSTQRDPGEVAGLWELIEGATPASVLRKAEEHALAVEVAVEVARLTAQAEETAIERIAKQHRMDPDTLHRIYEETAL